jgi:hypothetical protein
MTTAARDRLLAELLAGEDPTAEEYPDAMARLEGLVDDAIAEGIRNATACPCHAETVHQRGCGQAREES